MKLLIALALLIMATVSIQAQTQATATIEVLGVPTENKILVIGAPGSEITFKFVGCNPEKGAVLNTYSTFKEDGTQEMTDQELLAYFRAKLQEREGRILLQVNEEHLSRLVLNDNGTWSIVYE